MFNVVRKHHAKSNASWSHYCYIATEEKMAGKKTFYYSLIRVMRSASKQGSMIWNGICAVTNTIFNASKWKHNHVQLQKKKIKVMSFAPVIKPSSKFFVHCQGSPLVLLQSKEEVSSTLKQPKLMLRKHWQKETWEKKSLWQFLDFISLGIQLLEKMYKLLSTVTLPQLHIC